MTRLKAARLKILPIFGAPTSKHAHLREYIRISAQVLGRKRLASPMLHAPPKQIHTGWPERLHWRTAAGDRRRIEYAKEIVQHVASRFGISLPKVALRFGALDGHAGHVQYRSGTWYVDVDEAYRWNDNGLTAVLAHEFSHIVLLSNQILLNPTQRNEELTDTLAALAGFGRVMQVAAEQITTESYGMLSRRITRRTGYLTQADFTSLVEIQSRISLGVPKRRLRPLQWQLEAELPCLACGDLLRVPKVDARVRLACRVCGMKQDIRIEVEPKTHASASPIMRLAMGARDVLDGLNGF